ncbi:DUF302 domain-containing protein [Albirhodobacter sp. R86504]|jgi:uncharacterized protein (DUF302 family)|uniref:DUF302 domain-containing protein n=1 Tax=Albirhodobacter sp. R86504 TaxID=3093848 RepID=UPI0036734A7B
MRYLTAALCLLAMPATAEMKPRQGWSVLQTEKSFDQLLTDIGPAVQAQGMGIVTQAGPTETARARGITIPGNRVIGVFNNVYAVRILGLSTAAMIEAPVRLYVTENPDDTATLSYKTPTTVFAPYFDEGGPDLETAADELDTIFEAIAESATK